jgi:hypothetical protein
MEGGAMRIPNEEHLRLDLRIHDVVPDFRLEDVWRLPEVVGDADDFDEAVVLVTSSDPSHSSSVPTRVLWWVRDQLGRWLDLGSITGAATGPGLPIPGCTEISLAERLPEDLRGSADAAHHDRLPFTPLFRTDREYAAEISNKTVHGVLHLAWVERPDGLFQGQMAVYVKPRGAFGEAYMAFIKPFRYLVVYPALQRQVARDWERRSRTH